MRHEFAKNFDVLMPSHANIQKLTRGNAGWGTSEAQVTGPFRPASGSSADALRILKLRTLGTPPQVAW